MTIFSFGQTHPILIWEGEVPNSKESDEIEVYPKRDVFFIGKVQVPTIEVFLPAAEIANGKAVVICPGGGIME
ncbi:hypothetical protein ACFLSU_04745 [Bacteroidota bacterium]